MDYDAAEYIRYTIAWKLMLNRKKVGSVTEKGLVIAPREYWIETLKPAVEEMLQMKKKNSQRVRSAIQYFPLGLAMECFDDLLMPPDSAVPPQS